MELALMIEGQEGVTWEQWQALAGACEQNGISALFRSDHYLNLGGHGERGSLDALGSLCGLAAVTTTLRLGTMVSPATFRHPSELAKLSVTIDRISGGRFELGLGAGWHEREHAAYGFTFPPLKTRMDILEEQLQVVLAGWSDGPVSFTGAHYALDALDAQPKPVQRAGHGGGLPLIMGGTAGPRGARLAARYADEYNTTSYADLDDLRARKQRIDDACVRAQRPPIPVSVMTAMIVGRDAAEVATRAAAVERRMDLERGSLTASPRPDWIVGTVDQVAERLDELATLGISRVLCQHLAHEDTEMVALLGELTT